MEDKQIREELEKWQEEIQNKEFDELVRAIKSKLRDL